MAMTSACVFAVSLCLLAQASGSAIPMWEFLSRPEKASQLYYIYKKQVSEFCQTSTSPDCSKNYMVTGIQAIANMDEHEMDKLDPYQHGANELIWSKLSGNAASSRVAHEPDNSFHTNEADNQGSDDNAREKELYNYPESIGPQLSGPLVVRVLPDGRPVPGDERTPAPRDDDLEELRFERLPYLDKFYKRPLTRAFVYGRKPVKWAKNWAPLGPVDFRLQPRAANDKGLFFGPNEIPRYRRYYAPFDRRF